MDYGKLSLWLLVASLVITILGIFFLHPFSLFILIIPIIISIISITRKSTNPDESKNIAIISLILSIVILFSLLIFLLTYAPKNALLPAEDTATKLLKNASNNQYKPYLENFRFSAKYNSISLINMLSSLDIDARHISLALCQNQNDLQLNPEKITYLGTQNKNYTAIAICGKGIINPQTYGINDCNKSIGEETDIFNCGLFIKEFAD